MENLRSSQSGEKSQDFNQCFSMFLGLLKVSPHLPHRLLCFNTWSPVGWSCFGRLWYLWNESLADGPMLLNINISCWSWSAKMWKAARVSSCLPGPIPPYLPTMAGCELLTYEPKQASHSLRWLCRAPCQSNKESNNTRAILWMTEGSCETIKRVLSWIPPMPHIQLF